MKIWRLKQNGNQYSIDIGNIIIPCQIGKNGLISSKLKREGDLSTPIGKWKLKSLYYRQDKFNYINNKIKKKIPTFKISKFCGWCDDSNSSFYNQKIRIDKNISKIQPHFEELWRDDNAYDIFFELAYNNYAIKNMGSAIFFHCSFEDLRPTSGCVAMAKCFFPHALRNLDAETYLEICGLE